VIEFSGIASTGGTAAYTAVSTTIGTLTTADWTRISTTFEASTQFAGIEIKQTPITNPIFFDAVLIEETPVLDAYFDGANDPVYNSTNPALPDYQPERAFETYETEWVLD
jgi:hypothetical protein